MRSTLIQAPQRDALDILSEVKPHLRVELSDQEEDLLLQAYVAAARMHAEAFTHRQLIDATWEVWLDRFPECDLIELPFPPLKTVTSVKYLDSSGVEQTLSTALYSVSAPTGPYAQPGRIILKYGEIWPVTQPVPEAVRIRFTAGYGANSDSVPDGIRAGMLLHVGELYAHREDAIAGTSVQPVPRGVDAALWPYRTWIRQAS